MDISVLENGLLVKPKQDALGSYFQYGQVKHPQGLPSAAMDAYMIHENGERIDLQTWNQLVSFFMHYANKNLEVQARVYSRYLAEPQDNLPTYIVIVPKQTISYAAVTYDYEQGMLDLDGYEYTPALLQDLGYICFGHFHLHPFDLPNPSAVDDTNELNDTGLYGIVSLPNPRVTMQYRIKMTVVANNGLKNRRYEVNPWDLIDLPTASCIQTYTPVDYTSLAHEMIVDRLIIPTTVKHTKWSAGNYKLPPTANYSTKRTKVYPTHLTDTINTLVATYGLDAVDAIVTALVFETRGQDLFYPSYDGQYLLPEDDYRYA